MSTNIVPFKNTNIVKYGKNSPLKNKLEEWLNKNKEYKIYTNYKKNNNGSLINIKKELIKIINLIESEIN